MPFQTFGEAFNLLTLFTLLNQIGPWLPETQEFQDGQSKRFLSSQIFRCYVHPVDKSMG